MLDFDELQEFPNISIWATNSDFICDIMGTKNHQKTLYFPRFPGCHSRNWTNTDVAVLACRFSHSINAKMLFCIDTKQRRRYIDMTAIGQSLGEDLCKALPGLHALTGCDSTRAFVGKGKKQAFNYGRVRPKHVRCHDDG